MENMEVIGKPSPDLPHQIMERSVHQPHPLNSEDGALGEEHLKTIYKFLKDMNFEENADSMTHIHLRPVFQSPWYLGPTIIFYAALIGVGIIVNCVIAGKDFIIKCLNFGKKTWI